MRIPTANKQAGTAAREYNLQEICSDIFQGEYVLMLGPSVMLKEEKNRLSPDYARRE